MSRITFKEATDLLTANTSYGLGQLAEQFGMKTPTVARARHMGPYAGRPPAGLQAVVARAAREHAEALRTQAARLDALATELDRAAEDE